MGAALGRVVPGSDRLEVAIEPVLVLMLLATFLTVPFRRLREAFGDVRFLTAVGLVNVVVVPVVVLALSRLVASDDALLLGVLLVLLTPCVDDVIVFAGLAGGAADRLLAAAPLLLLAQILLLPGYLLLIVGPDAIDVIEIGPFVEAFLLLIVLPLGAADLVQASSGRSAAARPVEAMMRGLTVPLMMLTPAVVVASQVGRGRRRDRDADAGRTGLRRLMVVVGALAGRAARLGTAAGRALTFSGVTRNSLVVLPLALALPAPPALVPLVVVTQTLVELVAMVVSCVRCPGWCRPRREIGRPGSGGRSAAPVGDHSF